MGVTSILIVFVCVVCQFMVSMSMVLMGLSPEVSAYVIYDYVMIM